MAIASSSSPSLVPRFRNITNLILRLIPTLSTASANITTNFCNLHHINNIDRALTSDSAAVITSSSSSSSNVSTTPNFTRHGEYGRLLLCPTENSLPRNIEDLVAREGGPIFDFITKALYLPPLYVEDLIRFGVVHYAFVCPKPPNTATMEEIKLYKEFTKPSLLRKRPSNKGKTVREAQNTHKITHVDQFVEEGTYVRVHVRPKKFPSEETLFRSCCCLCAMLGHDPLCV